MKKIRTILGLLIVLGFVSTLVGGTGHVYGNPGGVTDNFDNENYIASKTNLVVSGGQVKLAQDCSSYGCAEPNGTGGCKAKAAGDYDLPACKKCDGISLYPVNVTDNTQDTLGSYTCSATCKKCSAGSCVNQTSSEDLFSQCPTLTCTNYIYGWSGNNCLKYSGSTSNNGYCNGSGACYEPSASCSGAGAVSASCGSAGCKKACVAGAPASSYDTAAEICYTSGQNGCPVGQECNASGQCVAACGGYRWGGYCWYIGNQDQTCNTVCASHGGCVAGNWNDDTNCTVSKHFVGVLCTFCSPSSSSFAPYVYSGTPPPRCYYRSGASQSCRAYGSTVQQRICACQY